MSVAFLLASKNAYFNYGLTLLSDDNPDIKCYEYREVDSDHDMLNKYNKVYLVCDRDDYFAYCFLMEKFPVTCLSLHQISYRHKKLRVLTSCKPSPVSVFNDFTEDERKIVYLYFFKRKRVREIATLTQLKENAIYYRIREIKIKLGAESTRKLPLLLNDFFLVSNI
jgi:hypothetical protein